MVLESLQRLNPPRQLGKMRLMARLGEGGMASVYVAGVGDGTLARLAAVKLLRSDVTDADYRSRFLDEAKVVARLHHNNLVDVREAGELDGQLYIAMELVEGRDLADVWDRCAEKGRSFPLALSVYIVREVLRGLHYAHTFPGLSLVHRDVSPSNVLVDWAGAVRLADFGLATSTLKATTTMPGLVYGKVGYMAPEQALRVPLDGRADAYACGVVLWELVTGRPMRSAHADTGAVARFSARKVSELSRRADPRLEAIIMRALANDRTDRFSSALDFMTALSEWLAEHAPTTTQETLAQQMADLFGDAREKDGARYAALLEEVWQHERNPSGASPASSRIPEEAIEAGTIIADRYQVERRIGRGGMGIVYLGQHLTVGRKVAIKVLTHQWSGHESVSRRFRDEARAASAVGHPNIVEVFDAGTLNDGRLYLVMEFLTGHSLFQEIAEGGPLSAERAVAIAREITRAIVAAHAVGIIHRDLKPDNVMLVPQVDGERIKVLDFGISASAERTDLERRLTRPGRCLGTPEYMAPEQAQGLDPTPLFDIYAIGAILYECLAGEPPFVAEKVADILARKGLEPAPSVTVLRPDVPPALSQVVNDCLRIDPAARPPSATALLERLNTLAEAQRSRTMAGVIGSMSLETSVAPALVTSRDAAFWPRGSGHTDSDAVVLASRFRPSLRRSASLAILFVAGIAWWRWGPGGVAEPAAQASEVRLASADIVTLPRELEPPAIISTAAPGPIKRSDVPPPPTRRQNADLKRLGRLPKRRPDDKSPVLDVAARSELGGSDFTEDGDVGERVQRERRAPSVDCVGQRDRARAASAAHRYREAIHELRTPSCWTGAERLEFDRMKTRALFEEQQFEACVKAGQTSEDQAAKRTARQCASRGSSSPSP